MKASKFMRKNFKYTLLDEPIYDALQYLLDTDTPEMPVLGEDGTMMGMLYEKDVLKLLYELNEDKDAWVIDYIDPKVPRFTENASLVDLCDSLIENNLECVPVVKDDKLIGIVKRSDIIEQILRIRKRQASHTA